MPNNFTPSDVAAVAVRLAAKGFVIANEVHRDVEPTFSRGTGHTAKVVIPGAATVHKREANASSAIPASNLAEQSVDVTLTEAHARALLGEAERSLDLSDYSRQVVAPLALAVADAAEQAAASLLTTVTLEDGITYTDGADLPKAITAGRAMLRGNGVQTADEIVAFLGVNAYAAALDSGLLEDSDSIRRVRVIEADRLDADDVVVAAPKVAFALAVRAPEVPEDVKGESVTHAESGFALRYVEAFDGSTANTSALVSAFVGATALPLPVYDPATGTVDLVEGGAAVRFTTAA